MDRLTIYIHATYKPAVSEMLFNPIPFRIDRRFLGPDIGC